MGAGDIKITANSAFKLSLSLGLAWAEFGKKDLGDSLLRSGPDAPISPTVINVICHKSQTQDLNNLSNNFNFEKKFVFDPRYFLYNFQ